MLFSILSLVLLPLAALARPTGHAEERRSRTGIGAGGAGHHELEKRQSFGGRATFYDVGLGACGGYNVASDFIVALNAPQYGGGYPGPNCGRSITISYGGKTAQATIRDLCPGCGYGDLDMSRGLFNHFASEDVGVFQMQWSFNDGNGGGGQQAQPAPEPEPEPTSTWTPPPAPTTSEAPAPTSTWSPPAQSVNVNVEPTPTPSSAAASASGSATSVDPFNIVSNSTVSGSVVAAPIPTAAAVGMGNLVLLNQVVTNYGAVIVGVASA